VLLKIVYLLVCRILGLAVLTVRRDLAKDAELPAWHRRRAASKYDIATLQTLSRRSDIGELTACYGLVVADECHAALNEGGDRRQ
jgi:hypothetical protein